MLPSSHFQKGNTVSAPPISVLYPVILPAEFKIGSNPANLLFNAGMEVQTERDKSITINQEPEGSFLNRVIPGEREKYVKYEVSAGGNCL